MIEIIFKSKTTFKKGKTSVEIILRKNKKVIDRIKVESADRTLEGLDKLLRCNKIDITAIRKFTTVDNFKKTSYTSFRILKSIEKGLNLTL